MRIGDKIRTRAEEMGIKPTALARMINTSKQNIYGIYKRESIDTALLQKLSKALNFDFFTYYSHSRNYVENSAGIHYIRKKKGMPDIEEENKMLRHELSELREKYELLRELYETRIGKKVPGKK